jgi:hypothetical protein
MKQFRVPFIMLTLVTFMTGFGNTTADLKQNSKTEFVAFDLVKAPMTFVNVVNVDFVANDSISFSGTTTAVDMVKPNCVTFNSIVTDVGWRYSQRNYKQLANTEKVMSFKDLYHKNKNQLKTNRIREDNPFSNSLPFYISNRNS